jgi:peroxin-5
VHERLVERLIDMARSSPEEVDPDVQIALGVLFNSSEVSTA